MATVLVIDDHEDTCRYMQYICKAQGIQCLTAATAETGISLAEQHQPGIIFIDLRLPGEISGWQAISLIKNDQSLKNCAVITISAGDHEDSAEEAGSNGYLRKPFTVAQVREVIRAYL